MQKRSSSKQPKDVTTKKVRPAWQVMPEVYRQLFRSTPAGQAVLSELAILFYDRSSVVAGDPFATHEREGERNVIRFIIQKCAEEMR